MSPETFALPAIELEVRADGTRIMRSSVAAAPGPASLVHVFGAHSDEHPRREGSAKPCW
jgi:hypothetical protein